MGIPLTSHRIETVEILVLDRGVPNAIGPELCRLLPEALGRAAGDPAVTSIVLRSGNEKFFSMGLDLPHLVRLGRPALEAFLVDFDRACEALICSRKPVVAAVAGHAVAGGCILTACCTWRVVSEAGAKMGLNEVHLGVPVPYLCECLLRRRIGDERARRLIDEGAFHHGRERLEAGLADEEAPGPEVVTRAVDAASALGDLSEADLRRRAGFEPVSVIRDWQADREGKRAVFLDRWFTPETLSRLGRAAEKFENRGARAPDRCRLNTSTGR